MAIATTLNRIFEAYYLKVFAAEPNAGTLDEYRGFVAAFYKGSWVADGWVETTQNVAKGDEMRQSMNVLGQRICGEWAKPNHIRTISTADLKAWGGTLGSSTSMAMIVRLTQAVERKLPRPLIATMKYSTISL